MTKKRDIIEFDRRKRFCSSLWLDSLSSSINHIEFSRYHSCLPAIESHFRNIFLRECLVSWRCHLVFARKINPELYCMLYTSCTRESLGHEFVMEESASCGHPLHFIGSYRTTMTCGILVFDFSWVDDRDGFESSMRMIPDSWAMVSLRRELPRTVVVEHEKWARVRSHITTITGDVLRDTESIADHMMLTRMFEANDFFLFHDPIIEKSGKKSTLFYKVYSFIWLSSLFSYLQSNVSHKFHPIFTCHDDASPRGKLIIKMQNYLPRDYLEI